MIAETHPIIEHATMILTSFVAGGGLMRVLHDFSASMAPLPPNAGWWTETFYNWMKKTGHDPTNNPPKPSAS